MSQSGKVKEDFGELGETLSKEEAQSRRRFRQLGSGEYPRTLEVDGGSEDAFASLSADIEAAVDRMQRQLELSGDETLQDTSEIESLEASTFPSARSRLDGSVVPSARQSQIRELKPADEHLDTSSYSLEDEDEEPTVDAPTPATVWAAGIDAPTFEKTLIGPALEEPTVDLDFDSDDAYADDEMTEIDASHEEKTSPKADHYLAGERVKYDAAEIDEVVQFHEGPTGVSSGHFGSDSDDRMHPWYDAAPKGTPPASSQGPRPSDSISSAAAQQVHSRPGTLAPQKTVEPAPDKFAATRAFFRKCASTTVEINLGYLLIGVAAVGLFMVAAFVAWLLASP